MIIEIGVIRGCPIEIAGPLPLIIFDTLRHQFFGQINLSHSIKSKKYCQDIIMTKLVESVSFDLTFFVTDESVPGG